MFKIFSLYQFLTLLFISLNLLTYTYAACESGIIEEADNCCTDKYIDSTGHFEVNPNVTSIGIDGFRSCYKLKSITMANNVRSIGNAAFYRCFSLTNIIIPDSISSIGKYAFAHTGLISIKLPEKVTEIQDHTFYYCKKLETVIIGNNIISIGQNAFIETKNLTNVFIGNNITYLFSNTFGQSNTDYSQLDITLKTISVKDNIIITPGDYYNNAILENNLIVKKRSDSGITTMYNCTKGYNISAAIQFTKQNCLEIKELPNPPPKHINSSFWKIY